jgi:glutamyl-tRNA synthetase
MAAERLELASRIAPSPTGPLHVGNACTFLVNWALARNLGWTLHLRVEDLDAPRVNAASADATREAIADLEWLGVSCDGQPVHQSQRMPMYERAMRTLAHAGVIYESPHSRSEVREAAEALSAPHSGGHAFPSTLRPAAGSMWGFTRPDVNHRLRVEGEAVAVTDELHGERIFQPSASDGDFIIWTKSGFPAYQLAVVVDDAAQGVTDVVRGSDLLPSAALQTLVYRALQLPPPRWWHVPMVVDASGSRMAKRRGSQSLGALRTAKVAPQKLIGLIALWTGAQRHLQPMDAAAFQRALTPSMLRTWCARAEGHPPTFTALHLEWLHS